MFLKVAAQIKADHAVDCRRVHRRVKECSLSGNFVHTHTVWLDVVNSMLNANQVNVAAITV